MKASAAALRISVSAMVIALSLVTASLPSLPGPVTKLQGLPLLIGGMLIGPRTGFAVGCITDLLTYAMRPTGPFFPGFTLSQALTLAIPGLLTWGRDPLSFKKLDSKALEIGSTSPILAYLRLFGVFAFTQLVTSVFLVSVFRSYIVAGTPLELELTHRAIAQAIHVPVYSLVALMVLQSLSRTDLYKRLLKARR